MTKQRKGWWFFCASFCLVSLSFSFFLFFLDPSRIFGCGSVSSWCCQNLDIFLCLTFCCIKWRLNLSRQTNVEHKLQKKRSRRVLECSSKIMGKKTVLKKSKDFFLFVPRIFCSANTWCPECDLQNVSSLLLKHCSEALSKLCHVVREGERKQLLFPLSKMAEGRGKAARSREEEPRSPSCSGEGWATRRASLPSFSPLQ